MALDHGVIESEEVQRGLGRIEPVEQALLSRSSAAATWIARLAPAAQDAVKAGPEAVVPGHDGSTRGCIGVRVTE